MKVAYLLGSLNRGGAETLLLDVFRNTRKASFDFIGIHRKDGAYRDDFYTAGPKMILCAPKHFGYLSYLWRLRKILLREDVTVVHAQQSIDGIYAYIATIGTDIKIITTFHGYLLADSGWLKRKVIYTLIPNILCVSKCQKQYYEDKWMLPKQNKLEVLYNGIDFSKFDKVSNEKNRALQNERIKLCMVGSFNSVRNQFVVLEALAKMESDFDFYFIGTRFNGEEWRYDECVRYCEGNGLAHVHFMGGRGDVPELLRQMDGFVYATRNDTFGIAVVEAMAAGLPVVVNDHPVMKEVCGDAGDAVRYFRTDDVDDAAAKIEALLSNIEDSKQAAKANAEIVRERYSIEHHIKQLETIYKKI